jgi:hypothetical protein
MKTKYLIITLFIIALQIYCQNVIYVTPDGSGIKNGSSWENAASNAELQDILFEDNGKDIWLSQGTYKPTYTLQEPESERDKSFFIFNNNVYGGFVGNETDISQRNIKENETIFSGDIGVEGDNSDNCYHVINAGSIIIDGITICYGYANGSWFSNSNNCGGGVFVENIWQDLRNCTFRDNFASNWGGAAYAEGWGSYITFENCLFSNNRSEYGPGGAIESSYTETYISNCTFVKNTTPYGGCVSVPYRSNDDVLINNNIFWKNTGGDLGAENVLYSISHNAVEGGYDGFCNINLSSNNTGDEKSPYFTDPDNNDYSLLPQSPLIDKGVYWNTQNNTDITGSIRPRGEAWDIGAYEYNSGPLTTVPPEVNTLITEFVTVSTARVRGNVTSDGGSQMITKGVYYSTTPGFDPATQGILLKYNLLYSEGEFYLDITNLPPNTTYYYRIYCENRVGSDTGDEMSFTTRSGVSPDANGILYAKPDGIGDGSSWANALHGNDLQLGIDNTSVKEIWLAKGKYVPTSFPNGGTIDRQKHFSLKQNVVLYGGFNGTETDLEQRDLKTNKTVLSGDIGAEGEYFDNTYHVFYHTNRPDIDSTSVIDGITLSDGGAFSIARANSDKGGGMYNGYCSPTIRNCTFENNRGRYGGGMYNLVAFPTLKNCALINNTASASGGGLFNRNEYDYKENKAAYLRTIKLYHCTVAGNTAPQGSQITFAQEYWSDDSYIEIFNSVIWGTDHEILWCDIDNYHQMEEISRPSGSIITFCGLTSPEIGEGNITISRNNTGDINSPYFTNPDINDYSLQYESACKDRAIYRYAAKEDILGIIRPQGAAFDMGAYEYETTEPNAVPPVIGTGSADSITVSSAVCHTDIITDGGIPLWQRGVKVSTQSGFNPVTEGFLYTIKGDYTGSEYSNVVTALVPDSVYYYVSYAENMIGFTYSSSQGSFTTLRITPDLNGIIYIKTDGTGNGSSWAEALNGNDLQAGIYADSVKQVWVAKGTYYPTSWPSAVFIPPYLNFQFLERTKHFSLKSGVELLGGFEGIEEYFFERNFKLNETILSGDIGIKDDNTDNIYNIIINFSNYNSTDSTFFPLIDSTAVIDGFTITNGFNSMVDDTQCFDGGAGMINQDAAPTNINCNFTNNTSGLRGGAILNTTDGWWDISQSVKFENCSFSNNYGVYGGAVCHDSYGLFTIKNCSFNNNESIFFGSAVFACGDVNIQNCIFIKNHSDQKAALFFDTQATITNSTIAGNSGGIYVNTNNLLITNSVFFNNGQDFNNQSTYAYAMLFNSAFNVAPDFEYTGSNNIIISKNNSGDINSPYFSDPDNGHWWLQEASPLKDAGIWTDDVPLYDIMGNLRDSQPDIGCYEYDPTSIENNESSLPLATELYQNYPNPFNPATNIKFALSKSGKVELSVYNIAGQLVRKLVDKEISAGFHSVKFEADDLNSGMYFYKLKANGKEFTKKMLMVK